ncbi:Zn2/Cys6 DNA-binding protein [Glarea lozoyensis ATCC 20868]|uniref:Zn2/Cys6 DNA-binding protein n=1 Tax=Glarea lozoyensis (strain ATCC 20868 / MF5171) TaxID=1116229 RepID=S3D9W3_GLAL2|nr:Zn2/Cys6 DNA-binding protein [Glarea lozoyensis ATCC 20868]EPE28761.1 Zn2/Cys6 DNA-binding protein [Glarea lozoyensis ATCC 20868]
MADEIRLRAACDRCHSQKLRCPKKSGEAICDRCLRAGASCMFSPFRQKKPVFVSGKDHTAVDTSDRFAAPIEEGFIDVNDRLRSSKRKRTSNSTQNADSVDTDTSDLATKTAFEIGPITGNELLLWGAGTTDIITEQDPNTCFLRSDQGFGNQSPGLYLNFDEAILESPPWYNPKDMISPRFMSSESPMLRELTPLSFKAGTDESMSIPPLSGSLEFPRPCELMAQCQMMQTPSNLVRQLSELSIELYDCSMKVPPQAIHSKVALSPEAIKRFSSFSLEEVVCLTQKAINLYPHFLIALFGACTKSAGCAMDMSINKPSDSSVADSNEDQASAIHNTVVDHSAILLVLSCHLRLVSIWEQLLLHMSATLKQPSGNCFHALYNTANCAPPNFKLGSYVPPTSITVSMHMLLYSTHFKQLYNFADELSTNLQFDCNESIAQSFYSGTGAMSFKAVADVKERTRGISTDLKRLVGVLQESGLVHELS